MTTNLRLTDTLVKNGPASTRPLQVHRKVSTIVIALGLDRMTGGVETRWTITAVNEM